MSGVWMLGAALGAALGVAAAFRRGGAWPLGGALAGACAVGALLAGLAAATDRLIDIVRLGGIWTGVAVGLPYGAVAGYLLGGLGVAFFGFLFRPEPGVGTVLRRSFGRGALVVAAFGGFFGALSGAVVGALRRTGLL